MSQKTINHEAFVNVIIFRPCHCWCQLCRRRCHGFCHCRCRCHCRCHCQSCQGCQAVEKVWANVRKYLRRVESPCHERQSRNLRSKRLYCQCAVSVRHEGKVATGSKAEGRSK